MKFYDFVTFVIQAEDPNAPGNWKEYVVKKQYMGDWKRIESKWTAGDKVNDDRRINNQLEIVSDPFAELNWVYIRSVRWRGHEWAVSTAVLRPPRIVLEIGGLYNAPTQPSSSS